MKKLYDFERCQAAKPDGRRCPYEATEYVKNPDAPLPYQVCGVHKRSGERSLALRDELPAWWSHCWKAWVPDRRTA